MPDEEDDEIEFASPPCSLSELSPEFAGLAPREVGKTKGKKNAPKKSKPD